MYSHPESDIERGFIERGFVESKSKDNCFIKRIYKELAYGECFFRERVYREWVYNDRKKLRKKFKKDKKGYKAAKNLLRDATGQKFWRNLEIAIRHKEAISSDHPVLAKLWYFWTNHFTISDKDMLSYYTTGVYIFATQRPL